MAALSLPTSICNMRVPAAAVYLQDLDIHNSGDVAMYRSTRN